MQGIGDGDVLALVADMALAIEDAANWRAAIFASATNWGGSSGSVVASWIGSDAKPA